MWVMLCGNCRFGIRVIADSVDEIQNLVGPSSPFWPDQYRCPKCESTMTAAREQVVDPKVLETIHLQDLSPMEAFIALQGCGLPDEIEDCKGGVIRFLLLKHPIVDIRFADIPNTSRCRLDAIELDGGITLHLGASAHGATVFRISRKTLMSEKVP